MHTDHITSHSKGGKITIENGQTLCAGCNLKKVINKEIPKILKKIDLKKRGITSPQTANNFLKFFITQFRSPCPCLI
jgi:5-methylcytosine-specific restriction endonuclease McrA